MGLPVFPLPHAKLTEPVTSLEPHPDLERASDPRIANEEEIG